MEPEERQRLSRAAEQAFADTPGLFAYVVAIAPAASD
jgi:hypothetical protein